MKNIDKIKVYIELSFTRRKNMAYLKLIQYTMQKWAETLSSALNVDVTIADKNLTRIVGTGYFYNKINEDCPEDSLFAKVIKSGIPNINLIKKDEEVCKTCSSYNYCSERANMSYPLKVDNNIIGVISFASFDIEQAKIMNIKKDEYFNMLEHTADMIEKEIARIKITNKLKDDITGVNEIINCLNKGIIILNSNNKIMHINVKALGILDIDLSNQKILDKDINTIIKEIKLYDTGNKDLVGNWSIKEKEIRVRYKINKILLKDKEFSLLISFDAMKEIINIAKTYVYKEDSDFSSIIGESEALLKSINKSKIAAITDSTILIQGESGTGKELLARSIHSESHRADGPFIAINCASIPENLIESELFGYERGAFTGANPNGKKGKIELANNGTLFLDEIGDLSLHIQTKLLRVLQERTIDRVGGSTSIDINIRVISATHANLIELVNQGNFRLDLFYRLNVIPIDLPPLKDRDKDVFLCSDYIINKISNRMNKKSKDLSKEVKEAFVNYSWPGNIRELENILEHCICFSMEDEIILKDIPEYFFSNRIGQETKFHIDNPLFNIEDKNLEELKRDFEKKIINNLMEIYGDTLEGKRIVAEKLNIGLTTLYRKINGYTN